MKLTARAAAETISVAHNIGLRDAGRVLTAGLAGPATRQGSALLYDEERLDHLLDRPECPSSELDRWRPFIVRVDRKQSFDTDAAWGDRARAVAGPWRLPLPTSIYLAWHSSLNPLNPRTGMRHPLIGVIADWVAVGAEITGYDDHDFRLEPPGPWFDSFEDTWLPLPPRRRWMLWGAPSTMTQPPANPERTASQSAYKASRDWPADDVPVRSNGRL
ncbi:hypothetical protein [Nocardioides luteus]|uniref:Uncharacterized protein n=1 Tax=Nocardioides luteus TaxID=1844 RepID=A0A1J4N8M1_9ACTN|nr:hypothetical protein [Nocardioides luteus]OIJ27837.1 hypothetical protein UG56_005660 [Nocardioides luteus]